MSHRLEENEDTKYAGNYKEPKMPRTFSTAKPYTEDKEDSISNRHSEGDIQTQSAESIWELARKGNSNSSSSSGNRGSFADMDQSVDNIIEGIEKGANKAKVPDDSSKDDVASEDRS
ncbi:MAG TPA: hypothetical protein VE572_01910 [Nitrososphaeraceae archaeon]|nr:hypothetical protein [Nitrososphaeraceae archaeon]